MGRPPCCDKIGVKKGPWTPEEDIMLVSYIQEHGPGNWRAVPVKTGLMRCSKSCRLRWTNYLRPGIRRGNFTDQEEKLIIHLQALLGNRWAAIASYLPERTDNDIKNYWNTHLRKKLRKLQNGADSMDIGASLSHQSNSKGQWERRLQTDIHKAKQALREALSLENTSCQSEFKAGNGYHSYMTPSLQSSSSKYAANTENISRLLQGWMKSTPKIGGCRTKSESTQHLTSSMAGTDSASSTSNNNVVSPDSLESFFGLDSVAPEVSETSLIQVGSKPGVEGQVPLSMLETWLFDEYSVEQEGLIDMSLGNSLGLL